MSESRTTVASSKGMSTLVRARFGPGMLLQHEDLEQLGASSRELSRLLLRSLLGCGVVCGLAVRPVMKCGKLQLTIEAGLALDGKGDPIQVPQDQTIAIDVECDPEATPPFWIVLCGTTTCCAPRSSICGDDDQPQPVCTRERDGFEIRVLHAQDVPGGACGCGDPGEAPLEVAPGPCRCAPPLHPCYQDHYRGACRCACGDDGCGCVLLAVVDQRTEKEQTVWHADHRVRRFIRPVLMLDPEAYPPQDVARASPPASVAPQPGAQERADAPEKAPPARKR